MERIKEGVQRFRTYIFPHMRGMFGRLSEGQEPHALMITCSDSRVVPNLITDTAPGELFIERNPGNMVPIFGKSAMGGVSASIEYAVGVLNVPNIIVCGHSDCGAVKGMMHPKKVSNLTAVKDWLGHGPSNEEVAGIEDPHERLRVLTELNVLMQVENLKTHPSVAARLKKKKIGLYGWVFDIECGEVRAWNEKAGKFEVWPPESKKKRK
ncbi:MAG: carbonic anhydrase [Acidobacteriota bacterium]